MVDMNELSGALISGKAPQVKAFVQQALEEGVSPQQILSEGLIAGMSVVGTKFKNNEFYVPEVLIAARAMKSGMELLKPRLAASGVEPIAKALIGTVEGDQHDIGKNLVAMMLEGAGFEVIDLGVNVSAQKFISAINETGAKVLCMSALLTTTMPAMSKTIKAMEEAGIRDKVIVMVGGAPVTQSYADEIGANGYSPDAASAVDKARELLSA